MDCCDHVNLQLQLDQLKNEKCAIKHELDFTKHRLLLKIKEIGSIKADIVNHKNVFRRFLSGARQGLGASIDQNDNSIYIGDFDILDENVQLLGVAGEDEFENGDKLGSIIIEELKEEVVMLKAMISSKDTEIKSMKNSSVKQRAVVEKIAQLVANQEIVESSDEVIIDQVVV